MFYSKNLYVKFKYLFQVHHIFKMYDAEHKLSLNDHCEIHILELRKWAKADLSQSTDIDRWIYLFQNEEKLDQHNLPPCLQTDIMREAVMTLNYFTEDEKARALYESRYLAMVKQVMEQQDLEELQNERDQAVARADQATARANQAEQKLYEQEQAMAEQAKLLAELQAKLKIKPSSS